MERFLNSFVALLFGSGIVALIVGPFTGLYGWGRGLIGLTVLWVLALTLRVYLVSGTDWQELTYSGRHIRR